MEEKNEKKVALNDELLDRIAGGGDRRGVMVKCPNCGIIGADEEDYIYTCYGCGWVWEA